MKFIKFLLCLTLLMIVGTNLTFAEHLQLGSKGNQVKKAQQALNSKSYKAHNNLKTDGIFGTDTQLAVISFQNANGLNPNGIVDLATKRALGIYIQRTLERGSSGDDVRDLQVALKEKGCGINSITGNFQSKTHSAVKKFQNGNQILPTGIADDTTIRRLNSPGTTCKTSQKMFPKTDVSMSVPIPFQQKARGNRGKKVKVTVKRKKLSRKTFEYIENNIKEVARQIKGALKRGLSTIIVNGEIVEIATIIAMFSILLPIIAIA